MKTSSRRTFLKTSFTGWLLGLSLFAKGNISPKLNPTPPETAGPFYPITPQKDKDFDLTHVDGKSNVATGQIIWIEGMVLDTSDKPIEDASVELWQANAAGRYNHPYDSNSAPLDKNFQGWAIGPSGEKGQFRFKTIMPGAYPASSSWMRPPHIHFKISKQGYVDLITQMYFPDNPLNERDRLLSRKSAEEQNLMIATRIGKDPEKFSYRLILQQE